MFGVTSAPCLTLASRSCCTTELPTHTTGLIKGDVLSTSTIVPSLIAYDACLCKRLVDSEKKEEAGGGGEGDRATPLTRTDPTNPLLPLPLPLPLPTPSPVPSPSH